MQHSFSLEIGAAGPDTGIVFVNRGTDGTIRQIPVSSSAIRNTDFATVLGDAHGLMCSAYAWRDGTGGGREGAPGRRDRSGVPSRPKTLLVGVQQRWCRQAGRGGKLTLGSRSIRG